jgi:hypothetical protein
MKHLKKINEFFEGDYDHFDEISPEQAYQELENDMNLPKSEEIKEEIEDIFKFIEKDGLNPYEMSFDEFYKWASENFTLEYPKSFYETEFKIKVNNPNQMKLDFNENKKIKLFNQWS